MDPENKLHDIVISGMSGRFPSSNNIDDFEYNLYSQVNMVDDNETRHYHSNPLVPRYSGKIPIINKFDAKFFGISPKLANFMDPLIRITLEEGYKAVVDAGLNPESLRGSNTGVYIANSSSEAEKGMDDAAFNHYGVIGASKSMIAHRLSYMLGLKGPSLVVDTACSSSIYALDLAVQALRSGRIDAAIVGGANLCLHPNFTLHFALLGILTKGDKCCPFDTEASGYIRSETISYVFLQRRSAAKRIYAHVICSKTNCDGFKVEGLTYPSSKVQEKLLNSIYDSANINLDDLGFLEAHCTGTIIGDPEECKAIDNAICKKRSKPLLIGSVKSNCGHSEPAAGMCSLVKVLLAFKNGVIAPNINFTSIKENIESLKQGRLQVIAQEKKLLKPYAAVNSFGFGGANAHVLLKQFEKTKPKEDSIAEEKPCRLVLWSGRTEDGVAAFFNDLEKRPIDEEYLALVQNVQSGGIKRMNVRGYAVLKANSRSPTSTTLRKSINPFKGNKRPLVWVFSGMGSQWTGMGKSLMQIPIFNKSIQRSHNVLKPSGLDLENIITSNDPNIFNSIMNSFVGIAAIQIALVDVLRELGLSPDIIIGHSLGEQICGYADGCLTAEQTILTAYYRGKVSIETDKIRGSMVAVGMGQEAIREILPETIEVACHNSANSCTISGPSEDVARFVESLKSTNVFTKEVSAGNIAYHSKYIDQFGPPHLKYFNHIIPNPKPRSRKWITTSYPRSEWYTEECKYASAAFYTRNFLGNVYFEESAKYLPRNALTIEIAPHALIQSILKAALPNAVHIGLTKRNTDENILNFFDALGSLYTNGFELNIEKLYPAINFPVSQGTRCLSPFVIFDHSEDWHVPTFQKMDESGNGRKIFSIQNDDQYQYLMGHEIDGRVLVPATFYLECVWRTFASLKGGSQFDSLSVELENIRFERATTLTSNNSVALIVAIQKATGHFEVTESDSLVASGTIKIIPSGNAPHSPSPSNASKSNSVTLSQKDFYKELKLRGYHYKGDFQGVLKAESDSSFGRIQWINNWVTFMDCMLQMSIINYDTRTMMLPTKIRSLKINPVFHKNCVNSDFTINAFYNPISKRLVSGGIEITGLEATGVQRRPVPSTPVLEKYQFLPQFPAPMLGMKDIARCCIQLVLENQPRTKLQILELTNRQSNTGFIKNLRNGVEDLPLITGNYMIYNPVNTNTPNDEDPDVSHLNSLDDIIEPLNILILPSEKQTEAATYLQLLDSSGFLIIRDKKGITMEKIIHPENFCPIGVFPSDSETFILLHQQQKSPATKKIGILRISSNDAKFNWMKKLQDMIKSFQEIILFTHNEKFNGLLGLVNCLLKEPETKHVRCVFIDDPKAPPFDINNPFYAQQLQLQLAINVYRKGSWGTYRHLDLPEEHPQTTPSGHVSATILRIGDMSSFRWAQGPLKADNSEVKIVYSSLNFRDVMIASGRLPIEGLGLGRLQQSKVFGFEFSGVLTKTNKPIMGMVYKSAVSSHLSEDDMLSWEVPEKWSLREAATVPVVYLTVYYAFFFTADIRKGKSILIHAGSGGIGIAAIRVATAYGLEVYTTVSTPEKKAFLLKTFPTLNEKNIGNSRDTSFEEMIMERTNGKGVDFVLNSLSEDKMKASLRCLGKKGHFMEIGKFDMANDNSLELGHFVNEISFHAILADNLLSGNAAFVEEIKNHIREDIKKDIIKPLPSTVFKAHELEQSFRYLMGGKHIGKVLLQIRETPEADVTLPMSVVPQIYFSSDLVYIIPGGLGGFGLELVDWMILRGARKIVLSSSRGISNDYQKLRISIWKSYSCNIVVNTSDIGTSKGCMDLINASAKLGPIGGIFNLAVALRDAAFTNQTPQLFEQSFLPKALATKHLDEISRRLCPKLKYFVIFSSVSCGRGNAGQTNYGMANSIMERIVEDRVANGFPGKAIQWGAIGEVGLVAEMAAGSIDLEIGGTLQQRLGSCLEVLDTLLTGPDPIVASMVVAEKKIHSAGQSPVDFVLNVMSVKDIKSIPMTSTLAELGMDSLMTVEIQQAFERDYDITLNTSELRTLTFGKLVEMSGNVGTGNAKSDELDEEKSLENLALFYGQICNLRISNGIFDHINDITDGNPIIIISGIDGCSGENWRLIGKRLDSPAYLLMMHHLHEPEALIDIINYGKENIMQFLKQRDSTEFRIIGYSFGALLTHHIVGALEDEGYHGKVIAIDGSPLFIQTLINALLKMHPGSDFEKVPLAQMLNSFLPSLPLPNIKNDLKHKESKDEWFQYIYDNLREYKYNDIDFAMQLVDGIYHRLKIMQNPESYKMFKIIDAQYLLVMPTIKTITKIDDTYGLSSLTKSSVQTEILDGNHQTILDNDRLPNLIRSYFIN